MTNTLPLSADMQPAITWLNMSGDVTITWDDSNKARIKALVEQKMSQGYSFFVLTPRFIPLLGNKKTALTRPAQLDGAVGVVVPDAQVAAIVSSLGDEDVDAVVRSGAASLAPAPASRNRDTVRRATSADDVLGNQTVAVRAIVGG